MKSRIVCLMGPTASGKTQLAIQLAGAVDAELISVDSALVYRGLDVGAAKPDYPHHLIDIRDPAEPYSAADFATDAMAAIEDISRRGKLPLLVGGTMLYFRALLKGMALMPEADPEIRADIERQAEAQGWPALHAELAKVDPASAERIHPNHSQRLSRALEVYRVSGIPLSEWHARQEQSGPLAGYQVQQLAISPLERSLLHQRIEQRFAQMLSDGLLEEVRMLYERGDLNLTLPAVRAVGYRQLWQHLAGDYSLEEATHRAVAATRQLAKRQLTWLRKWPDLDWLYIDSTGNCVSSLLSDDSVSHAPLDQALKLLETAPRGS